MKKTTLVALALSLAWLANGCGPTPNAIHAQITLEPTQKATCVVLRVQPSAGGTVLDERKIDRAGKDVLNAAIFHGSYPKDVLISAEPLFGASGCTDPMYPNGQRAQQVATFPDKSFIDVNLALAGPTPADDADGDGYAGSATGGPDCNDGDASIHPDAAESCTGGIDSNCNGKLGCSEPTCAGKICSEPPASIAFVSAPQALAAGTCSGETIIQTRDAAGAAMAVAGDTQINLAGPSSMKFYSDSACTPAAEVTGIVVPTGASQRSFYFSATAAGTATITATLPGLAPATQAETINPSNAMALAFRSAAQTLVAGACSGAVTLQTQDVYGNASAPAATLAISLGETGPAEFTFYSDPGCTAPITQLTLAAGSSSAGFHFKGLRDGTAQVTASATGFTSATQNETIAKGTPAALAFTTAAQSVTVDACSAATSFHVEDAAGNPVDATAVVTLAGTNGLRFFSDAACTTEVFTVSSAANGTGSFYFKGPTPGPAGITLTSPGLTAATQNESILSAGPTLLAFLGAPTTATAGACSGPIQVEARDSFGTALPVSAATTVTLAALPAPGFGFYSNSSCATSISLVSIAAGASRSGDLYVRGTASGSVTFTGTPSPAGLTPASNAVDIRAAAAAAIVFASAAQTVAAGQCSGAVALRARDTYGNTATLATATDIALSSSAASGFAFYGDAACGGAPATKATIPAGQGTVSFYFRANKAGSVTLTADASAAGLGAPTQVETVNAASASVLAFTSAAKTLNAGQCSTAVNVQAQDAYGNPSNVAAGLNVGLSAAPPTGVTFWTNNTCSTPLAQLQIAPGANNASPFYFKATAAGALALTASAASFTSATQNETVSAAPASALAFTTASQTVTAGQCSAAVTVQTQDAYGNPTNVATALSLSLTASPSAGFTFYSDAACGTSITTSTVAAGANTTTFWFKSNKSGTETVSVSGSGVGSASQDQTVQPGAATALRITTAAQNVTSNACSAVVDFQPEDANGNASPVTSLTNVTLSATNGLTFYSDAACATAVTTVPLAIGQAVGHFYFKGATVGSAVVTLTAPGLGTTSQNETISAGGPTTLVFLSPPSALVAGACSGAIKVESRDSGNNPANVTVNTTVNLAASPGTSFAFYSNSTCTTTTTTVTIAGGTSQSGSFYVRGTKTGTQNLTGSSGSMNPATAAVTLNPAAPSAISFTSVAQTVVAGQCSSAVTLRSADAFGNDSPVSADTLVSLSGAPSAGLTFYGLANCGGGAVTQALFPASQSVATFYFKAQRSGTLVLSADATGATPPMGTASQNETITPDVAAQLAFTSAAQTRTANACSAAVNVQAQDQFGNPSAIAAGALVSLASNPSSGFGFYSDSACSTAAAQTNIAAGAFNAAPFYFKGTQAGAIDVTVSSGALAFATQQQHVQAAAASALAFTTPAQTVTAGTCSAVASLQTQDAYGNVSAVAASLTVNLAASPTAGFTFYSDAACTTTATSLTIAAGASSGSFYFKGGPSGSVAVTASGTGVTSATQSETVNPGPASVLKYTSAAQNVTAGACSLSTNFRTEDSSGNAVNVSAATAVGIAVTAGPSLTFYSDSGCATAVASVTLAAGTGAGSFWFKGTTSGTATVTLSAGGFTSATQNETIQAAGPTKLAFLNAPSTQVAGACSAAMTIQSQDSFGSPAAVTSATTVSLSAAPSSGFAFYSNSACTTTLTSVSIANGTNTSGQFYIRGTNATSVSLTAATTAGMSLTPATLSVTITPATPSAIAFTTSAQSIVAGTCSAITTVRTLDGFSNTSPVSANTTVNLTASPSAGFTFYSDASCGTAITSSTILSGQATTSFYFKGTRSGAVTITADATGAGLGTTTQVETLGANVPSQLAFTSAAQTRNAGVCSAAVNVQSQDQYGNASNVSSATTVTLSASPATGFDFYSDSGCTSAISQVAIAVGAANAAPFYFKGTSAGGVTVTAANASFTSGTQTEQILPTTPTVLVFETAAQTRTAGQCSTIATIRTQDTYGNIANVAANLTVNLTAAPPSGFTFYSDATCTTAVTTATVASGSSSASFYFKGTWAGTVTVTAAAAGYTPATQPETIQPEAPNKLTFVSAAQTIMAGNCSAATDFRVEDTYGNASNVSADKVVSLAGTAGLTFYSDSACSASISSVTVAAGTSAGRLYFKGTQTGTATLTLAASGLTGTTQNETITAPPATVLAFLTPPTSQLAGACSGAVRVESRDLFNNPANVAAATTVALSAAPPAGFAFYSNSTCTTTLTSVAIAAGASQSSAFYVRGTQATNVTMTGASGGFTSATAVVAINPATPSGMAFSTAPQTVIAGSCSGLTTLTVHDAFGNTSPVVSAATINLSASPAAGFAFYSDAACSTAPVTWVQVASGSATASFYFKGTNATSVVVTADGTAAGLATTTQAETIQPTTPSKLAFTSAQQTRTAGQCSAAVNVQAQDQYGNPSAVASATTVGLAAAPSTSFDFYSDAACTMAVSQTTIASGASAAAPFYFKGTTVGTVTVTASAAGLASTTQPEQISPATPSVLVFETMPQTRTAGQCSGAATLRTQDAYGNIANVAAALTVNLTAAPAAGFTFYSDSACTTAITTTTVASGASSASFYFKGTTSGSVLVTAAATGYTSATQTETITPDVASKLSFTSLAQTVTAGACSAVTTFESEDAYGNRSNVSANTTVNISGTGGLAFYSDSACTAAITWVSVPMNTATGQFFFSTTTTGSPVITLAATGLTSATQIETIQPPTPTALAFLGAPSSLAAGACSAAMTIQSRDQFGNPSSVTANTTVNLTATPPAGFGFYSNNTCTTAITTTAIASGTNQSTQFYVKGTAAVSESLAGAATGFSSATAAVNVTPATPSALVFTSAAQSLVAGTCSAAAAIRVNDAYGNASPVGAATTLNLSANPATGFTFYSDSSCATATSTATVASGASAASFWFKSTKAGSPLVTVDGTGAGLGTTTQAETITPAAVNKLAFTSLPQSKTAGACSAVVNVESQDQYGNPANVAAATAVDLTASPAAGFTFYSDSACTTSTLQTSIAAGASAAAPFYFKGTNAGSVVVTAAATGLASGTQTEILVPASPSVLVFQTAAQAKTAGQCSSIATLQTQDAYGNVSAVAAALTVNLTVSPTAGFTFYSDATCTTTTTTTTVPGGGTAASFYFKSTKTGSFVVTAAATGYTSASQTETITADVPNKLAFTSAPQTFTAGLCSATTDFEVEDTYNNQVNVAATTTVGLSGPAGVTFYSDSTCSTSIASVDVAAGTAVGHFFFKGPTGSQTITISATGLASANQTETLTSPGPAGLQFINMPASLTAGACVASSGNVQVIDQFGNPVNVTAATTVNLSGTNGITFYSKTGCVTGITSTSVAAGANTSSNFWFRLTQSGAATLTAAATGLTNGTYSLTVNPGTATAIDFLTAARSTAAGVCSPDVTVRAKDANNNTAPVAANTTVNLAASPAIVTFYTDSGCTTPATSVTILATQATATFYYRGTTANPSITVTASTATLGNATQVEGVTPSSPSILNFTSAAQTRAAGVCSAPVNVEAEDQYGNASIVAAGATVALTAAPPGGFGFYSDATCATPISQTAIPAGSSAATAFYFKGTTAGSVVVTAAATGLTSGTQTETIGAGTPNVLVFQTAPQTRTAGQCSTVATVGTQDSYGNVAPVGAALTVNLTAAPAGGFTFYSDAACTISVTTTTVASGASSASFYFKGTAAGSVVVTAAATGYTSGTQTETIQPDVAAKLAFTTGAQTIPAGSCSAAAAFETEDAYNNRSNVTANTTVNLSGTGGLAFYSDNACTTSIASVAIASGSATGQLYFKTNTAGSPVVTLAATGLTSANQTETIQAAGAQALAFVGAPSSQAAGACSAAITVQSRDTYGNPSNVAAATTVSLTATPPAGFGFYSNNTCTTAIASTTIAAGANQSTQLYVKGTTAASESLSGAATGFTSASAAVNITPATPSALVFTSAAQSLVAGTCSTAADIRVNDAFGNASPVGAAATLNLSANPTTGFTFYSDSACTASTTTATVASGASTTSFWFKSTKAGSPIVTVDGTGAGLGTTTQTETITPSAVNKLNFVSAAQSLSAGACSAVVNVESEDQFGNPAAVGAVTAVDLTASPTGGFAFYTDATCATTTLQTTIAAGASAAAPFYFKGTSAGSVVLTAAATGLASGTQSELIVSLSPTVLVFTTAAQTRTAGQCSGIATVQTQDTYGNVGNVGAALTVNLSAAPAGLTFYSNATCTTTTTTTSVPAGSSTASFYFKTNTANAYVVTAAATGYASATQTETITGDAPSKLIYTSASQSVTAGICSAATAFQVQDQYSNNVNVTAATTVNLSGSAGVTFYSDASCTVGITSVLLSVGQGSGQFYWKATTVGSATVTLGATGLTGANQTETITSPGPYALVFLNVQTPLTAGGCSTAAQVQVVDQFGSPANVTANTTVNLSGVPATTFYSNNTCGTLITTRTVFAGGNTSGNIYFKINTAGPATLTAAATGLQSGTANVTVNGAVANGILWATPARTATAGTCSAALTVSPKDQYGNVTTVTTATNVTLSAAPNTIQFYTDAACGTAAVTSVTIPANGSGVTFYFSGTAVSSPVITATVAGWTAITQAQSVVAAAASKLAFTSGPQTRNAGQCSAAVGIQSQDTYGNPANVTLAELVTLSAAPAAGFTFYSDSACTTAITQVTIPAAAQAASFFFSGTRSGTVSVTVTGATLAAASQNATINAGAQSQLAIITAAQSLTAGACSTAVLTVQTQDTYGNPATGASAITVNLGNSLIPPTDFLFYATAGCGGGTITTATIAAGTSSASVYLKGLRAGPVDVTASATGFTTVTQQQTVTAAAASKVVVLGTSQNVVVGNCSNLVTVQSQDAYGNVSAVTANTQVNLSGGTAVTYSGNSNCNGGGITSVSIAAGTSSATFYFKSSTVQTFTLTANVTGWTPDGTQAENIVPQPPTKLVVTTPARSQMATASCSQVVTVQAQDGSNNPSNVAADTTINLTSTATGTWAFYSDAACTAQVTSVTMATGTNSKDFYFVGRKVEAPTVTAAATGLTSATQGETITAGPPTVLKITSAPLSLVAGNCSSTPVNIETRDAWANASVVTAALAVSLTSTPTSPDFAFFTNGTCASQITTVSVAAGASTASFNVKGNVRGSATITVAATGYTSDTQTETIDAGAATKLAFTTAAQTVPTGVCSGITTVQAQDALNNPISTAVTATLSATAGMGGTFYSDSTCATSIGTTLNILAPSGQGSFYFKATTGGSMDITATSGTLTSATQTETIGKMVHKNVCTLAATVSSANCPFPGTETLTDMTKSILFFQATNDTSSQAGDTGVSCYLQAVNNVVCDRNPALSGTPGIVTVYWYVVEFPQSSAVHVERLGPVNCAATLTLANAVNPAQSFLLVSTRGKGNATVSTIYKRVTLGSDGRTLTVNGGCTGNPNGETMAIQAVDFPGAVVTRGTVSFAANSDATVSVNGLADTTTNPTFLLYGYSVASAGAPICSRMVRGYMPTTTSLRFSRGDGSGGCTINLASTIDYERVVLPVGRVQAIDTTMANGGAQGTGTVSSVDLTRTTAFTGGQPASGQATGETSSTSDDPNDGRARQVLSTATTLNTPRGTTSGTAHFTTYVVEWANPP